MSKEPVAAIVKRVKRQRDKRLAEGWQYVQVWVPTKEDGDLIRSLASKMRNIGKAFPDEKPTDSEV